jgi:5-hydroxyisourate hydrolase-like protein (transthyretin family)
MHRSWLVPALLAVASLGLAGCPKTGSLTGLVPASGTVTMNGSPVAGATVTFFPTQQGAGVHAASAMTDETGKFQLTTLTAGDGVMAGNYQVTIMKREVTSKAYTAEEAQKYMSEHKKPPPVESKDSIAEKFSRSGTSGLTATVSAGAQNVFNFTVEAPGAGG